MAPKCKGTFSFKLFKKLQFLKEQLRVWKKGVLKNIFNEKIKLEKYLA